MSEDILYCKDCKFYKRSLFARTLSECTHPELNVVKQDLVTGGKTKISYPFCEEMRKDYSNSKCGSEGKLYDPKNEAERKIWQVNKALTGEKQ
jgi:hypothetical protein